MSDIECRHCNDTGYVTVLTRFPMTYVCAGSPPDDAKNVTEARCDRCDPVARWQDEVDDEPTSNRRPPFQRNRQT